MVLGDTKLGDRTMLDALLAAAGALEVGGLDAVVEAAKSDAAFTAEMAPPPRGRSSYLGERAVGIPDPGAEAVAA